MANNYIKSKRKKLIEFINEQVVGPGAYRNRYGLDGWDKGEVIDTTPGSVYCSGILFPKKDSSDLDNISSVQTPDSTLVPDVDDDATSRNGEEQVNQSANPTGDAETEEASREINQRFPQTCGLSCCLNRSILSNNDLNVYLSGRYYRKVDDLSRIFVNVDAADLKDVEDFLLKIYIVDQQQQAINAYYKLESNKLYLLNPNKNMHKEIKLMLDEANKTFCKAIRITDLSWKGTQDIFLASYKEYLYNKRYQNKKLSQAERDDSKLKIVQVERAERVISYFMDLLSALDSRGYGFWYAEDFCLPVPLSGINLDLGNIRKVIYKPGDTSRPNNLKDVASFPFGRISKEDDGGLASLSVWIQLTNDTRDSSNDNIYLKIMAENTSDVMKETVKNQFSIVNESVNARSFFGIKIEVASSNLSKYKDFNSTRNADEEAKNLNYLYRKINDYGVGHICSVDWDDKDNIKRVWTVFIPEYDVPDVDVVPQRIVNHGGVLNIEARVSDTKYLEFGTLSTLSQEGDNDILRGLRDFIDAYKIWIDEQIDSAHPVEASKVRKGCFADYDRMKKNLELLNDSQNMLAFRLMNTAMFMQLWHAKIDNQHSIESHCRGKREIPKAFYENLVRNGSANAAWRSFQLAFIILNMDGIIQRTDDPEWECRNNVVDLVWFPTGGGKTEAYLGIIAFCIITRRVNAFNNHSSGGGTTAIMRYTLRLLATQQFQRAMRLILALESIRKWRSYPLGDEQVSIGLFVGNDSLPNKLKSTRQDEGLIEEATEKWMLDKPSKIPLDRKHCPWCGGELEWAQVRNGRQIEYKFRCKHSYCFHEGLPVLLCDELVYETPPTLLFGTADKFAMVAHKVAATKPDGSDNPRGDSRRLFQLNGLSPDLIIQDELHLLCGPLGSAVGLFECAIEQLCSRTIMAKDGHQLTIVPKIVSSTATTRNTEAQIRALYGRNVNVFPKNGLDYDDSFYAFYKRNPANPLNEYLSKRKYVGILPTGRTAMYTQLRLASCCMAHRAIFEKDNISNIANLDYIKAADYYFTLVDYFNSKKDVGTTDAQFSSEFPKYTRQIFARTLRPGDLLNCYYAYNEAFSNEELTGRLNGEEVVNALAAVQQSWNPNIRDVHTEVDNHGNSFEVNGVTPPDLVLATNMISVGIDVSRFNSMLINSMPRNKAEYIQATSRVARDELGIVFTLHNPFRARDVSHYEQFKEFHEKLYFYVEPISITPFSQKTIERYLPLYLSTIIRHRFNHLAKDADVTGLSDGDILEIKKQTHAYFTYLSSKCSRLGGALKEIITPENVRTIDDFTDKALKEWKDKLGQLAKYSAFGGASITSLYVPVDAYEEERLNTHWVVPTSVRVVPVESALRINNE